MKKYTAILLLCAMLASLGACGAEAPAADTTAPADTTAAPVVDTVGNGREFTEDSLPETMDFGGETITVLTRVGDAAVKGEFIAEEETGDIVNDAVWARNMKVEERLNVKIDTVETEQNRHLHANDLIKQSILAGSDDFDIIANHLGRTVLLALDGLFKNLNTMPHLDLDQPWWNQSYTEMTGLEGKLYSITGELSQTMVSGTYAMFFNRTMFEDVLPKEPSLYETVNSGKWTMDKMMSYTSALYNDVNGNAAPDEGDRFGFFFTNAKCLGSDAFVGGCNIQLLKQDGDEIKFNGSGAEVVTYFEKMNQLLFRDNNTLRAPYNDETVMTSMNKGQVMFTTWMLTAADYLRDMKDDFGIVPMPKLDDTQKEYSATAHNGCSVFAIPVTCKDSDAAAALLEALGAETYRKVTPAYFEVALKVKYSRDDETAQMLDLIVDSVKLDLATVFGQKLGGPTDWFRDIVNSSAGCESAISTLASRETSIMSGMDNVKAQYKALEG
ncbi:MAG: hypothetical protein J6C52_06090 [Clostridia bacterium]|nr:hypothetical protein [Clostridia bacterium]